jgi:membrane fusion protein (multidrug efflux system)
MRPAPFVPTLAAALALAVTGCGPQEAGGAGGPPGGMALSVETATITPQSLSSGLQTVGSLRADEAVVVRPEIAGRIERIHFQEGGHVRAGQALFSLDASLAQASLNEALANLENSRRAATRAGELSQQQLIAQADYDRARAAFGVDAARVASARTMLAKSTLRAPFAGQVGLREVSVGAYVNSGDPLLTLVRLDPIEVDFSVPENALAQLARGQQVAVSVDAYPGEQFAGALVAIDPVIDPDSRSIRLRAQLANPDGRLRPGQFARLRLRQGDAAAVLLVPEQALMQDGDTRFVYTVVEGKAKKTVVKTGQRVPGKVEVIAGLGAGAVVITAGQAKPMLRDGTPVQPLPPEAAPAPAKPTEATTQGD